MLCDVFDQSVTKIKSSSLMYLNTRISSNRIATASSRPKKEFKPKSITSSLETVENNQHNGLSHTSSVKTTGISVDSLVTYLNEITT